MALRQAGAERATLWEGPRGSRGTPWVVGRSSTRGERLARGAPGDTDTANMVVFVTPGRGTTAKSAISSRRPAHLPAGLPAALRACLPLRTWTKGEGVWPLGHGAARMLAHSCASLQKRDMGETNGSSPACRHASLPRFALVSIALLGHMLGWAVCLPNCLPACYCYSLPCLLPRPFAACWPAILPASLPSLPCLFPLAMPCLALRGSAWPVCAMPGLAFPSMPLPPACSPACYQSACLVIPGMRVRDIGHLACANAHTGPPHRPEAPPHAAGRICKQLGTGKYDRTKFGSKPSNATEP